MSLQESKQQPDGLWWGPIRHVSAPPPPARVLGCDHLRGSASALLWRPYVLNTDLVWTSAHMFLKDRHLPPLWASMKPSCLCMSLGCLILLDERGEINTGIVTFPNSHIIIIIYFGQWLLAKKGNLSIFYIKFWDYLKALLSKTLWKENQHPYFQGKFFTYLFGCAGSLLPYGLL